MLIAFFVLCMIAVLATNIWTLVIIFKRSVVGGILSLVFGLPILYYLVTGWGKEGEDIKVPFFLTIVIYLVGGAVAFKAVWGMAEEAQRQQMAEPPARSAPSFRETSRPMESSAPRSREPAPSAAEAVRVANTPPALPAQPAMAQPVAPQPVAAPRAPAPRVEVAKEAPRRPAAAQSNCVYKPVMTDEDLAKCR